MWHRLLKPEDLARDMCDVCGGPFDATEADAFNAQRWEERKKQGLPPPKPFDCKLCDASFSRCVLLRWCAARIVLCVSVFCVLKGGVAPHTHTHTHTYTHIDIACLSVQG